jgi:hypothetical protein
MTNRIKILLAIFSVLLVLAVFSLQEEESETEKATQSIALTDSANVMRIEFRQPDGKIVNLMRQGQNQWILNQKFEARSYLVQLILAGLTKAQVKREVAGNSESKVKELLKEKGYSVILSDQKNTRIRKFLVALNETDPNSAYYLAEGDKTPLVIFVPGFEGSIANVFALPLPEWRSKDFFRSTERTLQKVSVEYPQFPKENFTIFYNNGKFELKDVPEADTTRIYGYLQNYQYLTIYQYLTEQQDVLAQNMKNVPPLAILSLESLTENRQMKIWENKGKMLGKIEGTGEFVSLRTDLYGRLLVKKSFFVSKQ